MNGARGTIFRILILLVLTPSCLPLNDAPRDAGGLDGGGGWPLDAALGNGGSSVLGPGGGPGPGTAGAPAAGGSGNGGSAGGGGSPAGSGGVAASGGHAGTTGVGGSSGGASVASGGTSAGGGRNGQGGSVGGSAGSKGSGGMASAGGTTGMGGNPGQAGKTGTGCTDPMYPQDCPTVGDVPASCWTSGTVCSTIKNCSGTHVACNSANYHVDCSAPAGMKCVPNCTDPMYPQLCPSLGDARAGCFPATTVCATVISCGDQLTSCQSASLVPDCASDKCMAPSSCPSIPNPTAFQKCSLQKCCSLWAACSADSTCTSSQSGPIWDQLLVCSSTYCASLVSQ